MKQVRECQGCSPPEHFQSACLEFEVCKCIERAVVRGLCVSCSKKHRVQNIVVNILTAFNRNNDAKTVQTKKGDSSKKKNELLRQLTISKGKSLKASCSVLHVCTTHIHVYIHTYVYVCCIKFTLLGRVSFLNSKVKV